MRIVRGDDCESSVGATFTGDVILDRVMPAQTPGGMSVSVVHFHDGARTNWHEHPSEQILIVLTGAGRVGDAGEQHEIGPGDVVHLPPNTRHWHGARPGKSMTHISVTNIGSPTWYESPEE
jgi:quercetin dioxygenase-like cupin family protein